MLEPWVIEEIKRREQEREQRPELELPLWPVIPDEEPEASPPAEERGVVVIDL